MSLLSLLSHWKAEPTIFGNVSAWRTLPSSQAQYVPIPSDLHPEITQVLVSSGIQSLYSHQAEAWEIVRSGKNPVIVTGTASGKTLCYNLPVLDRLLNDPEARALYLFPTKALSQDQLDNLKELRSISARLAANELGGIFADHTEPANSANLLSDLPFSVYDGDTPAHARPGIRTNARLVITNPDMLHTGILPHHTRWVEFLSNLQFVVIDEVHAYRGVFGSHVANVIRRLKRVARFYGAAPQFILTSATIANPEELAERLIEEPVVLVDGDGSARGTRHFVLYNPPLVDRELGIRRSALLESVRLAQDLLQYDVQTIIFGRARRTVELILTYLRQSDLPQSSSGLKTTGHNHHRLPDSVRGYRSGYLPGMRREIERGLRQGEVRAVVATNALELGIDIGGMGASVLAGYPGTIAATWQQAGRAGRGSEASLAVLVTTASPLDQFLAKHPEYFFDRSPEHALINPDNLLILLAHLRCASFEIPFWSGESFGNVPAEQLSEFLEFLREEGQVHRSGDKYFWMSDRYPAESLSLRSASSQRVLIQVPDEETWITIGEVDTESAPWMVHPEAIYMHEAQTYLVESLDLDLHQARMRPAEVDYYTEPRSETTVQLLEIFDESPVPGAIKRQGEINVTTQTVGFRKVRWFTHEQMGLGDLSLPPTDLQTTGYWIALSEETVAALRDQGLWTNDPNRYGQNWEGIKAQARARDGYRCQVCGIPEEGRAHDVHHKIPFRTFASYEQANQLHNLITLCPGCHRRVEAAVRMRSGLSGVGYALGNLAPFFLMCDTRDLGVHSDPSSPLAEGGPAVVIFDRVPAGIGFSQRLYEFHAELIQQAYELVSNCECIDGCPSCVGPAGENGVGGKKEALALLAKLVS
jgi:DEAD/DEAH box helicase domain-containing protein